MLEVLTDAEEISRKVVVEKEVLDFILDLGGGDAGIIPQAGAIADLGVEYLTSGEGFVLLDVLDDFERHLVVAAPRDIREIFVNYCRHNVNLLTEDCGRVDGERCTGFIAGHVLDKVVVKFGKRKVHNHADFSAKLWTL